MELASQTVSDTRSSIHEMATALTEQSQSVQSIARDMQVIAGQSETQHAVVRQRWRRWRAGGIGHGTARGGGAIQTA